MWVRRLLVVPILLSLAGLAVWLSFFHETLPDSRMACYYGAYDFPDGRIGVVTPSTGLQSLRLVAMNGETWFLQPLEQSTGKTSTRFSVSRGWTEQIATGSSVEFGSCDDGKISIHGDFFPGAAGTRRVFDITEATFESHGLKLYGRLVMPRLEGAIPVAVLVHGSERDSGVLFNRLQYLLPANGIGVFVYDKRGTGKSEGNYTQDFELLSDDAAAALTKARELVGSLASEVGFQGGSQAGWIEPLAAKKVKADFVVVCFGLGESPLAEDRDEVFDDLRTAGFGEDVIAKAREITDASGQVMSSHFTQGFDQLNAVRTKYEKEPWFKHVKGEYTGDFLAYPEWLLRIAGPWLDQGTSWQYDPLPALQAYQGPHLWVLAGRDSSAPSANTLRILRDVQATHSNLDVVLFPNADHGIIEFEEKDGERIETRFSQGYFQLMVDWILFKEIKINTPGPIVYDGGATATASPAQ